MSAILDTRRQTIAYWEKRRILFNLVIILPTAMLYQLGVGISAGVGDTRYLGDLQVAVLFIVAWIAANFCYSFVYALEFVFGLSGSPSTWVRGLRPVILIAGCAIGVYLSPSIARNISGAEYTATWISSNPTEE